MLKKLFLNASAAVRNLLVEDLLMLKKNLHNKSHQCGVCLKCFGTKQNLTIHMKTHTGEKSYVCSVCDRRFARKDILPRHQATHSDERKYKCELCPDERYFKTKNHLSIHMQLHYEPKHSCVHCNKKFHTSSNLKSHEKRIHADLF